MDAPVSAGQRGVEERRVRPDHQRLLSLSAQAMQLNEAYTDANDESHAAEG
jgi:hypothetical protein